MGRPSGRGGDVLPGIVVAGVLVSLVIWNPALAGSLVREDAIVEWLQVMMAAGGLGLVVASGMRRFSPADVFLFALLFAIAASEMDLDQRLFGTPVVDPRFFRLPTVPWPVHVVVGTLVVGVPLALLAYGIRRRRELGAEVRAGLRDGWLRLLVAALVFIGIAQAWERELNHLLPLPKYFLEETLEAVGVTYLALAMLRRVRARPRRVEASVREDRR